MWPFAKKQAPVDTGEPPGLNVLHGEAIPEGGYPIVSAHYGGPDGWSSTVETIPEIDNVYTHYDQQPADAAAGGAQYYADRNSDKLNRSTVGESWDQDGKGWYINQHENQIVQNPYVIDLPRPSRPTSYESPSNWRFYARPDGLFRSKRNLNGMHFSMAQMHRSYPILGMEPAHRFRNTYRIEPPSRDAMNTDIPVGGSQQVPGAIYASPNLPMGASQGGSYRLM